MHLRRAAFGGQFKTGTAWTGNERRVGILVDRHALDSGRWNSGAVRLNSVHDQRNAVSACRVWIEEALEGRDVVIVEDGSLVECSAFEDLSALVAVGFCRNLCGCLPGPDFDRGGYICKRQGDGEI